MKIKLWAIGLISISGLLLLIYTLPAITANFSLLKDTGRPVPAEVLEVVDAQTLLVRFQDRKEVCVVLNGVNTPLRQQDGYRRSVLGIIDLIQGSFRSQILVKIDAVLNSKVWLAGIYDLEQEVLGNLALIRFGYAWPDTYLNDEEENDNYLVEANSALVEAKKNRRGHWAGIHLGELPLEPQQSYLMQLQALGHSSEPCQP
ncbi:thermonuclease family protein [Marinospirillum insulare]|uniref:Endonuclease YncB, thermonuclease family n=1 Tax=Marinospirillum insulare TaxID=217169 RepID=A0ABQ5ZYB2_9GAMM|nr:hypothetical protein [Marinospirillum insulare]GLR65169.1 hypothetical protein GCM10007878_26080 [Marinospirillum insulare]